MAETPENFPTGTTDPEATLVQPRFDEVESQTAQPVVPLSHETRRPPRRSRLPVALVLVSALLGGLVSVLAYRLYQRPAREQAQPAPERTATQPRQPPAPQPTQTPELTAAVPAAEETAPRATDAAPAPRKSEESAAAVEEKTEEKSARASEKKHDEEVKDREERRRDDEPRAARVAEPRARRVDVIPSYPDDRVVDERDTRRVGATDYQLPDDARERRRARRQKRRNIDRIRDIFGAPPPA